MIARAIARYIRITPRKFRQIIPLVKGKRAEDALAYLASTNKKAAVVAIMVLKSALDNAKRLHRDIDTSTIYISKIIADGGPMLKRFRAASMGRAVTIKKRTSHITIELDRVEGEAQPKSAVKEAAVKRVLKKKGR